MHVLHVVDSLAVGGAERMLVELANRAARDGHLVSVCVTRSGLELAPRLDPRIDLDVLGRTRRFEIGPLHRLARRCRERSVDVAHCHGLSSFSLMALLRGTRASRVPLVLHDHRGLARDLGTPRWFSIAKRYIGAYAAVYADQIEWATRAGVPRHLVTVIPNAIDMSGVAGHAQGGAELPPADGRSRLIAIGSIRHEKAIDVLLEAMAQVRGAAVLYLVGRDFDREYAKACRARAERRDLAGRVVFLGQREDARALAASADLAVHGSRCESGPLVLAEYAALELPFVSTRVGGIATELAASGVGSFVEPDDPVSLARAIDRLLELSSDERRRLGREWGRFARSRYDLDAVMATWYRLYDAAIGDG